MRTLITEIIFLSLLVTISYLNGQTSLDNLDETIVRKIADNIIEDNKFKLIDIEKDITYDNTDLIPEGSNINLASPYSDWKYWNGVINLAILNLSNYTQDNKYSNYVVNNLSFAFNNYEYFKNRHNGENKWNYPLGQYFILEELDDCGAMGASLIESYKLNPAPQYMEYLKIASDHISNKQDRLNDGTLVRSFPVKYTIWADDLFMGLSFLSRYAVFNQSASMFNDAANQVIKYHNYLFDDQKALMYHNWYSDIKTPGVAYWGRANGWALVAQIDLIERLPENHPQRDLLIALFKKHVFGVSQYQSQNGLWHQLLDKNDSYLETSCSAMFVYSIAKAVNLEIIPNRYRNIALVGWEGIKTKIDEDGLVEGVCAGTIVYDELKSYYERPTPINDIHGIGTVILAGVEILKLKENLAK